MPPNADTIMFAITSTAVATSRTGSTGHTPPNVPPDRPAASTPSGPPAWTTVAGPRAGIAQPSSRRVSSSVLIAEISPSTACTAACASTRAVTSSTSTAGTYTSRDRPPAPATCR